MLQSLREEKEGKRQMLLSPRKNGLTSLFEEVTGFSRNSLEIFFFIFFEVSGYTKGVVRQHAF